jgi:tetratricopeptide (TPR) repeat protein
MRSRSLGAGLLFAAVLLAAGCRTTAPPPGGAAAPSPAALVEQARKLDLAGQHDAAIDRYQQALAIDPNSFSAHYGIGRALDLAGRYDEGRAHLIRSVALASASEQDQAQRMVGVAWVFVGEVDDAEQAFRQVFERQVAAGNFGAAADVANEIGRVCLEFGDLPEAESWYRTGHDTAAREIGRAPAVVDLADMRWAHAQARIAARRGQAAAAHRFSAEVKRLLDKGGNDEQRVQYPYLLGYVAFYLGRYRDALTSLAAADQQDPFILLLTAEAHEKLGEAEAARDAYRRVLASSSHAVNNAFARPVAMRKLAAPAPRP